MDETPNPILIQILHGQGFVWNPDDVFRLRQQHRILGSLLGNYARQSRAKGLPLMLSPPEVQLLKEKGVGQLVELPALVQPPTSQASARAVQHREQSYQDQVEVLREERKREILGMADQIVKGKRKKLLKISGKKKKKLDREQQESGEMAEEEEETPLPEVDRETILSAEIAKIRPIGRTHQILQIFTSHPWIRQEDCVPAVWSYPSGQLDRCRLMAFRDLWNQGYYLSEGSKFSADYLVYQGDPLKFHAKYILICLGESPEASFPSHRPQELVGRCRLANNVTKILLLAWIHAGQIRYKSIRRAEDTEKHLLEMGGS